VEIKRLVLKLIALLTIANINWTWLSAVGSTLAYFNDTENSPVNSLSAGTLDFSLSGNDFSPDVTPSQNTLRTININNDGSLDFNYAIKSDNVSGDLCDGLNLSASLGAYNYTGPIGGFDYFAGQFGTVGGNWQFEISLINSDSSLQNKSCAFDFIFNGSQIGGAGFSDIETISNTVNSGTWVIAPPPPQDIVLNEFLPDPVGNDCSLTGLEGEWVEIYNDGNQINDLAGWTIKDEGGAHSIVINSSNTLNNSTLIGPKGSGIEWLVVFLNGCILNNTGGDSVSLYNPSSELVDSYSYSGTAKSGLSYARIPDGVGAWVDPVPTPGAPNVLTLETEPKLNNQEGALESPEEVSEESLEISEEAEDYTPVEEVAPEEESAPAEETILSEDNATSDENAVIEEGRPTEEEPVLVEDNVIDVVTEETTSEEPIIEQSPAVEQDPVVAPEPVVEPADGGSGSANPAAPAGSGEAVVSVEVSE